ncbi:PilC/PilY family type IV pilus protein [Ningiella sp. W23]|uniref:PilC/PilY family type IV pilus protein n=1 Tax=Ningiella sp. W23 TaxID=3023715 RepID=UPI003756D4A7
MLLKKISISFSALALSFLISFSAFGDDLEIYLGAGDVEVAYNPNVLFIMDTSGSMNSNDGTSESRMQRVQRALNQTLAEATNINAGLMRFSDHGGPILYPVTDIDKPLPAEILTNTKSSGDDAYEIDNVVKTNSDELTIASGTKRVYTGLRFTNINIPQGATITKALLRFTSAKLDTEETDIKIYAEDTGNSSQFEVRREDISGRDATTAELLWDSDTEFPLADETKLSPDLSFVIQEVINRPDWCGGNALSLILEAKGSAGTNRKAYASDLGESSSPQLILSYDESTASGCVAGTNTYQVQSQKNNIEEKPNGENSTLNQLNFNNSGNAFIGLRFQNVLIPRGANIKRAYVEFTAADSKGGSASQMTIKGVARDDTDEFETGVRYQLRDEPKTGAAVSWTNIGRWNKDTEYTTPELKTVLQEIINRSGWVSGNSLTLSFSNFGWEDIAAYTHRGTASKSPRLFIEFEGNAVPGRSSTVRDYLTSRVNELTTDGWTPIVDTLYEAAMYYGGNDVYYGRERGTADVNTSVRRKTRVSHIDSYIGDAPIRPSGCTDFDLSSRNCVEERIPVGARYISPVEDLQCQVNNHIVLLSDGIANNNHSVDEIEALLGKSCTGAGGEKCGVDLVKNITDGGTSKIGAQVKTHTIGFATGDDANTFLRKLAEDGGGSFNTANDSESLLAAFTKILRQVTDVNTTFVSPGVAVNQNNRLTHRDELYFALFRPEEGTMWPGNLKKYKVRGGVVVDSKGVSAVDSGTGFFNVNAHSYWSMNPDGNDVRKGGAASRIDLLRNLYVFDDSPGTIVKSANRFNESNASITVEDLALTHLDDPDARREQLLKWARGVDVRDADGDGSSTDINPFMGDPIHSQPIIINYSDTDSAIFVATNHGFIHSFNAETGEENFAIMPRELLENMHEFYINNTTFNHIYGIDGDLVYREADDRKILYVGMRRGGNNYYAFDVTNKTNPKLMFTIDGGEGVFENLGQTWSRPVVTKINIGGSVKDVLIFGGGYDEDQDTKITRSPDDVGNSVFIVDADNGDLLWSASDAGANLTIAEMKYSIPASISAIDRDADGLVDHMYVADMGGQLFRLDVVNGASAGSLVSGKILANLSGEAAIDNRRFYYGPDVSEIVLGDEQYYAVAIGSGYRAGPLNTTINDNFYMVKDKGVFTRDDDGNFTHPETPFVLESLYDATDHLLTSEDEAERDIAAASFATKDGWYIRLTTNGEKVLSAPLILDYKVFFSTYIPSASSESLCAPPSGSSRAYLVNLFNGNAIADINVNRQLEASDRTADAPQPGIAPSPIITFTEDNDPIFCLGANCESARIDPEDGPDSCGSDFECLIQNVFGDAERVRKDVWQTEIERE